MLKKASKYDNQIILGTKKTKNHYLQKGLNDILT